VGGGGGGGFHTHAPFEKNKRCAHKEGLLFAASRFFLKGTDGKWREKCQGKTRAVSKVGQRLAGDRDSE